MLAWLGELLGRLIPDDLFDCWLEEGEYGDEEPDGWIFVAPDEP